MSQNPRLIRRQGTLSAADVEAIMSQPTAENIVVWRTLPAPAELARGLVALANDHGGTVILVPDAEAAQAAHDLLHQAAMAAQPPLILPLAETVSLAQGSAWVVSVPPGLPHAYNLAGTFWTRAGGQERPLTTEEVRRLLMQRDPGGAGFEAQLVPDATSADLDPQRVSHYVQSLPGLADEGTDAALLSRGCVRRAPWHDLVPTYAGILLFGRDPQRFLRSAEIIAVRYRTPAMSDEFVRQDIRGTLGQQVRLAEAFVTDNMRRVMRIQGLEREEQPEYPISVVREALVNAIAHRDYAARGEGIRLLMFSDRLQIYSPGRLPGHVTLANLVHERYSRNETIVQVLSDLGYIERLGYGIDRMISAMAAAGLPAPLFEETAAGFQVTLFGRATDTPGTAETPAQSKAARALALAQVGQLVLNARQEKALHYLAANGRIANSDLQGLAPEVSAETIRRDLADLVEQGVLLKVGAKRATYYILK